MTDNSTKSVIWKFVPGFPDYEVSEHGDLRRGTKLLKPERVQGSGRKRFALSMNGRARRMFAHTLVALAFIGPKPFEDAEVCHGDGFFHNNHFSNLRWDTKTANGLDSTLSRISRREAVGRKCGRAVQPRRVAEAYAKFIAENGGRI